MSAVIVTSGLTRDLGGAGIVENVEFRRIVGLLREKTHKFVYEIVRSELRWRVANRELLPLIDSMPDDPELSDWASQFKAHLSDSRKRQDPNVVVTAFKRGDREGANSLGLIQLEQFLKESERVTYHPNKLIAETAEQLWALCLEGGSDRLSTIRDLVLSCLDLEGRRDSNLRPENPVLEVLLLRREGEHGKALGLCRKLLDTALEDKQERLMVRRMELELLLAHQKLDEARETALGLLCAENEEALDQDDAYDSESIFVFECLAHLCQLRGEEKRFDALYQMLQGASYCDLANAIRAEVWTRGSRGRLGFGAWLKRRVTASGMSTWFFNFTRRQLPRSLSMALQGRDTEDLEPSFRQFFDDSGRVYTAYLEAVRNNVAHQMRRRGEFSEADRLLATTELLGMIVASREILASGRSYFRPFG